MTDGHTGVAAARCRHEHQRQAGRPIVVTERGRFDVRFRRRDAIAPTTTPEDVQASLAWLFPDRLSAALEGEIDAVTGDADGITEVARVERRSALETQILSLERSEEELIERALAAGQNIARRPEADPRAILAVSVTRATAARAA